MEQYETTRAAGAGPRRPLCRLADDADGWGENFLAPILRDAGYRVASDKESGDEAPDVLLCLSDDGDACANLGGDAPVIRLRASRSEEHTSELQSLMRISYAVFCLKKKKNDTDPHTNPET